MDTSELESLCRAQALADELQLPELQALEDTVLQQQLVPLAVQQAVPLAMQQAVQQAGQQAVQQAGQQLQRELQVALRQALGHALQQQQQRQALHLVPDARLVMLQALQAVVVALSGKMPLLQEGAVLHAALHAALRAVLPGTLLAVTEAALRRGKRRLSERVGAMQAQAEAQYLSGRCGPALLQRLAPLGFMADALGWGL